MQFLRKAHSAAQNIRWLRRRDPAVTALSKYNGWQPARKVIISQCDAKQPKGGAYLQEFQTEVQQGGGQDRAKDRLW